MTKNGKYLKPEIFITLLYLVVMKSGWMENLIPFLDTYLQIFIAKLKLVSISPSVLWLCFDFDSQPAFTCSKLTTETLEQGVKYVQS